MENFSLISKRGGRDGVGRDGKGCGEGRGEDARVLEEYTALLARILVMMPLCLLANCFRC